METPIIESKGQEKFSVINSSYVSLRNEKETSYYPEFVAKITTVRTNNILKRSEES